MSNEPTPAEESQRTMYQLILDQISALRKEQQNGFSSMRAEFNERVGRLVASDMLVAEQRRVDERFANVQKHLDEADRRHRRLVHSMRWVAATVVVPVLLFGGNLLVGRL